MSDNLHEEDIEITINNDDQTPKEKEKKKDKSNILIIILGIIILLLLLILFIVHAGHNSSKSEAVNSKQVTTASPDVDPDIDINIDTNMVESHEYQEELENRNVYFAGLRKTTFNPGDILPLSNPPENEEFIMKFEIYREDTNEKVLDTDFIYSGYSLEVDPYSILQPGSYTLLVKQIPYMVKGDTKVPLTSAVNAVKVTLN